MPQIRAESLTDFTGGLNLNPDGFKLGLNESPDLCNVELSNRGGFSIRRGVQPLGTNSYRTAAVSSMFGFLPIGGTARILTTTVGGNVSFWDGSDFLPVTDHDGSGQLNMGSNAPVRAITFRDRLYMQSGAVNPIRWVGSGTPHQFTAFAFNDDLENPTPTGSNGKMPVAKFLVSWMGCAFVGAVTESATLFPNRVRWSHPNFVEDWHSKHFIDVDTGQRGDQITALVPAGDRLYVFKRASIHVVYGSPPEGIAVESLTHELGTVSQDSVVATERGVYFFDPNEGVFLIRPNGAIQWVFENIYPAMVDGRISGLTVGKVMLGYGNRRLWVSVPFDGQTERSDVFVLDPMLSGKSGQGGWTRFCFDQSDGEPYALGPYLAWDPPGGTYQYLAAAFGDPGGEGPVVVLDQPVAADSYPLTDPEDQHIPAWLMTPWIDLGIPAASKRWKRPEFVMQAGAQANVTVEGYVDYDAGFPTRRFNLVTTGMGGFLKWGTGTPANKWGANKWAPSGQRLNEIEQGAPLGTARAVALRFLGPPNNTTWGINQVTFKYIPRKLKG